MRSLRHLAASAALFCLSPPAEAVILFATDDIAFNTTAPTGGLAGSGWELQGTWGIYLGTPISSRHFITAKHIGGTIGSPFSIGGVGYTTVASYASPESDLRIWEISGTFSSYAELYLGSSEVGQDLVVFGRGSRRGSPVSVSGGVGGDLKGWQAGLGDQVQRWGENVVSDVYDEGPGFGDLLRAEFSQALGGNVATISGGDSGGAVFINDGGTWKLAGINYAIDGPFSLTSDGSTFDAALFDMGGLYEDGNQIADTVADIPASFYATRISANSDWILSTIPEPSSYGFTAGLGLLALAFARKLRAKRQATI